MGGGGLLEQGGANCLVMTRPEWSGINCSTTNTSRPEDSLPGVSHNWWDKNSGCFFTPFYLIF